MSSKGRTHYTQDVINQALFELAQGYTTEEVASHLKVGKSSISRWKIKNEDKVMQIRDEMLEKRRKLFLSKVVDKGLENASLFQEEINKRLKSGQLTDIVDDKTIIDLGATSIAQKTSTYVGTMVDKARLEGGESTENVSVSIEQMIKEVSGERF